MGNTLLNLRRKLGQMIFTEAAGGLVDSDDHLYRPLTESPDPDDPIDDVRRTRQRKLSRVMYHRHAIGGAVPDQIVSRVIGAGAEWKAEDEKVQEVVARFIADPDNNLEEHFPRMVTELLIFGELVLPIYLTPENADVRLGYLRPDSVETVLFKRGDAKKPIAVIQRRGRFEDKRRLWIIPHPDPATDNRYPPHPSLTANDEPHTRPGEDGLPVTMPTGRGGEILPEIQELLDGDDIIVAGYVFYHRTNCLVSGRGRSIYERINDWLKALDDWFFGVLRNASLQQLFIFWVKRTGDSPEQVKERQKELARPPKSGTVMVTNDKEEWAAVNPKLPDPGALKEILQGGLRLIGLSQGLPGHEMGAEGDATRSTAKESRTGSVNRGKRLQREIKAMTLSWLNYQIDQKIHRRMLDEGVNKTVECVLPELDARDEQEVSDSVKSRVDAMSAAIADNLVLEQDARAFVYEAMGRKLPDEQKFKDQVEARQNEEEENFMNGTGDRFNAIVSQVNSLGSGKDDDPGKTGKGGKVPVGASSGG